MTGRRTDATQWKQNKDGDCVFPRDTEGHNNDPHQACSVILEIYRESKFEERYKDRLLKQFTTEKRLCVCVWLNPHKTQNINPRVENREDEEWDTEEEKQKEMSAVSFRAQREDEREDEGASTRTERWLVIKKYDHKNLFFPTRLAVSHRFHSLC